MSWAAITNAVRNRFLEVVARPIELPVVVGNQPAHRIGSPTAAGWARVSVQAGDRRQVSTGAPGTRRFRTTGVAVVNLFAQLDEGDGAQNDLVDSISTAFLGVRLELDGPVYVHFSPPVPYGEAVVDDGRWWRRDVRIPFFADDFGGAAP